MADVKWIKITTDIFDDEKILMIESLPSSDSIIVIWFKLLTFAGKQNNNGVFLMSNKVAYTEEMLASIFRRDVNTVRMALRTFEQFGMIEIVDNVITIPNWNKHQNLNAYEKKKERDRLYQQNRRAEQKSLIAKSSDKSSDSNTTQSSDVAVSEEEKEIDKDIKKESKERKISPARSDDTDFEKLWDYTFSVYPKKSGAATAKEEWMKKLVPVIPDNRFAVAKLIYEAEKAYLDDYVQKNRDDPDYKYIPKFAKWLSDDAVYWIKFVEEKQRSDSS